MTSIEASAVTRWCGEPSRTNSSIASSVDFMSTSWTLRPRIRTAGKVGGVEVFVMVLIMQSSRLNVEKMNLLYEYTRPANIFVPRTLGKHYAGRRDLART